MDYGSGAQPETIAALRRGPTRRPAGPDHCRACRGGVSGADRLRSVPGRRTCSTSPDGGARAHGARHADVVIVYMHAGAEGSDADHVTATARPSSASSAATPGLRARDDRRRRDLVFASGPHVCAGSSGTTALIAYSLGNLAGDDTLSTSGSLGARSSPTLDQRGRFVAGRCRYSSRRGRRRPAEHRVAHPPLSHTDFGPRAPREALRRPARRRPDHTHVWSTSFSR